MYESIPQLDFWDIICSHMYLWKAILYAGVLFEDDGKLMPAAIQIRSSDTKQDKEEVIGYPELPEGVWFFKANLTQARSLYIFDHILKSDHVEIKDIDISFENFLFQRAAFIGSGPANEFYPENFHPYVEGWPKIFFEGDFTNKQRLELQYEKVEQELKKSSYRFHTLYDASNHMIGFKSGGGYFFGRLSGVLKIPIRLKVQVKDNRLQYNLDIPQRFTSEALDIRYVARSSKGDRDIILELPKPKSKENRAIYTDSMTLNSGDEAREFMLRINDRLIDSRLISHEEDTSEVISKKGSGGASFRLVREEAIEASNAVDPKKVWVVHGRNIKARDAMYSFLQAIGLEPMEWDEAVALSGEASPYASDVLEAAFSQAKAVVVLLTGDDLVKLDPRLKAENEKEEGLTQQARPNVLFESGMSFGRHPKATILVELGELRAISDTIGRNVIRMDNSSEKRQKLVSRLKNAGCDVKTKDKTYWLRAGDFDGAILEPPPDSSGNATAEVVRY